MFFHFCPELRYSPLSSDFENGEEFNEGIKLEKISHLKRLENELRLHLSISVLLILTLVVALSSGIAGYSLRSIKVDFITVQDQDTALQGIKLFHSLFALS